MSWKSSFQSCISVEHSVERACVWRASGEVLFFGETMSWDRFREIMLYLHFDETEIRHGIQRINT
jgi:hypothetical protein